MSNGYKVKEIGYLAYAYPVAASANSAKLVMNIMFGLAVYKLECSIERAKEVIEKAAECLRGTKRPEQAPLCEHCSHIAQHITRKEEER